MNISRLISKAAGNFRHIRYGIPVSEDNYKNLLPCRWWKTYESLAKKQKQLYYFQGLWDEFCECPIQKKGKIIIDLTKPTL